MGSFANSLHLKCTKSQRVADAVSVILSEQGWRPTTERVPDDAALVRQPPIRGLRISAPVGGWVSILDSDLGAVSELTTGLAERLKAHAIFFLVNDSDAWSYALSDPRGNVSEFDSMPDEQEFDEESLGQLAQATNAALSLQSLLRDPAQMQRVQELGEEMLASAPPEIRDLQARMRSGQFDPGDMQRFHAWSMEQMPKYLAQLYPALGNLLDAARPTARKKPKRRRSRAERTARQKRLDDLRPLLARGVSDAQVEDALDQSNVFVEESLAKFLPLLGIPEHYAYLSYHYLDESTPEDLSAHGIRFVHDLRFESAPDLRIFTDT